MTFRRPPFHVAAFVAWSLVLATLLVAHRLEHRSGGRPDPQPAAESPAEPEEKHPTHRARPPPGRGPLRPSTLDPSPSTFCSRKGFPPCKPPHSI